MIGENVTKKKDRMALSAIISGIPEDMLGILDAKKTAIENWENLRQRNLGINRVIQSRIQGLNKNFEMLTMAKTDSIADFMMKFTLIISELWNLGEEMDEKDVVQRFLRAIPSKFDALTISLEQYADLDKVSLDEIIGSFTIHELRLKERESREEEQTLLAKALNKKKLTSEEESSSCGRGCHRGHGRGRVRGHGRGRHPGNEEEKEKKTFDKSSIQCYNCQKYGHFAYECRNPKREREDRAYVANSAPTLVPTPQAPALAATSSLLMAIKEARSDFLLQGSEIDHHTSDMWYLDTSHKPHDWSTKFLHYS